MNGNEKLELLYHRKLLRYRRAPNYLGGKKHKQADKTIELFSSTSVVMTCGWFYVLPTHAFIFDKIIQYDKILIVSPQTA